MVDRGWYGLFPWQRGLGGFRTAFARLDVHDSLSFEDGTPLLSSKELGSPVPLKLDAALQALNGAVTAALERCTWNSEVVGVLQSVERMPELQDAGARLVDLHRACQDSCARERVTRIDCSTVVASDYGWRVRPAHVCAPVPCLRRAQRKDY